MPLPEGYLPREGDVLTIDVKVKHDFSAGDEYLFTAVVGFSYKDVALPLDHEGVRLKRRSWREGESVIHRAAPRWWGDIISTHGDHAVVALDEDADPRGSVGRLRIFHCNELLPFVDKTAAQEPPEAPAETPEPLPAAPTPEKPDDIEF